MNIKKSLFEDIPKAISGHGKKIIVIVVMITLMMGYFASNIDMEADKGSFYPDTEKTENLDEIEDSFGATEGKIQIVTIADDGDVLTTAVLKDMLDMKKGFYASETVNSTLISSNDVPDGIITLADIILKADNAFDVEESIMEHSNETEKAVGILQDQKDMYVKLNESLSMGGNLLDSPNIHIQQNATTSFKGVSEIVSEPKRWMIVKQYRQEFMGLINTLTKENKTLDEKIVFTDNLIFKLQNDKVDGYDSFVDILGGMNNILKLSKNLPENQRKQVSQVAIGMTVKFLSIPESMPEEQRGIDLSSEMPTLSLSENEKRQRLDGMDDSDVKEIVYDVINYDSTDLNESVKETISNLDIMMETMAESMRVLEDMNSTLSGISTEDPFLLLSVSMFKEVIQRNNTILETQGRLIQNIKPMLSSADQLGSRFQDLEKGITKMLSVDFDEEDTLSYLSAKSALSIVQMDSSLSKDIRLETQKELIGIAEIESEHSTVKVFASQVMMDQVNDSAQKSLYLLLPIAFLYVVVVLILVYRSVIESLVSLLSLFFAVIWTFGAGVLLGYQFNPLVIAVPILMTGLGIDYGIHMIMRFREERSNDKDTSRSMMTAIMTVGGALLLVTVTTAVGFSSTTLSGIEVMKNFGVLATIGIISSFILFVTFLPAVVQRVENLREGKKGKKEKKKAGSKKKDRETGQDLIARFLSSAVDASDHHPKIVLIIVLLITISSAYGAMQVETTFDLQDFLPEGESQYQNIEYIKSNFDVHQTNAYILTKGDLTDPVYLYAIYETQNNMENNEMVVTDEGLSSPLTVIQRYGTASPLNPDYNETIVRTFLESDINSDQIPDQNLTKLYDMLFKNPGSRDAIENVVKRDSENGYDSASAIIQVRENSDKIGEDLDNAEILGVKLLEDSSPLRDEGYTTEVTSSSIIDQETIKDLNSTQINSLIAAIMIVAIFLTIVFYYLHGSKTLGLITTFPVSIVSFWVVGSIYLMNIPLNFMTVSVTALTVGIGVAYSIHITHRFIEERKRKDSLYKAMHDTIQHTGGALLGALLTTIGALGILAFSEILPLSQFGYVTAMAIVYSFLASVFVLPSALMLWARCGDKKECL